MAPDTTRRQLLQGVAAVAASPLHARVLGRVLGSQGEQSKGASQQPSRQQRRGRIRQSVARWCYQSWSVPVLCQHAAGLGLEGVDLLQQEEFSIPAQYGLRCTMGYAGGGSITQGLNRTANHDSIVAGLTAGIPLAQKANVPNVITFSGLRDGISDEEGALNIVAGLKRIAPIAEAHGVTVCIEVLNSRRDHPHYMADHTAWTAAAVRAAGSPRIKILYDAYHMQIMEGDLIETLRANRDVIAHIHTGGVPGRHELDAPVQEVEWPGLMRALLEINFEGYVAHEFIPTGDPLTSLADAVTLCDV